MKSPTAVLQGQHTRWYVLAGLLWVSSAALSVLIHDALARALPSNPWHVHGQWPLAHSSGEAAAAQLTTSAAVLAGTPGRLSSTGYDGGTWVPPDGPRRLLLLTYANAGYSNWMLNWAAHVRRLQTPMLVVALDDETAALCAQHNIPYMVASDVKQMLAGASFRKDRAGKFRTFGSLKGKLAAALLKAHNLTAVILSDTDVAWLRDPAELLELQPEADILISTDCLSTKTEMQGVINGNRCGHTPRSWYFAAYNTGVVIARNTPNAITVLEEWSRRLSNDSMVSVKGGWILTDQLTLNAMWRENGKVLVTSVNPEQGSRVVWLWDNKVKVAPLPGLLVSSGQATFVQRLHQQYSTTPYAVHATFQLKGGNDGKIQRFKEAGLWLLEPPEYYSSGRFLTWKNVVEEYVEAVARAWQEEAGAPMQHMHKHMVGMAFQRQVIADAVSLGHTLNRTVVPPPFLCWCEEDWVADVLSTCTMPGSDTTLPFRCSSDHVLSPTAHWQGYIRHPGFLQLPQVPVTLRRSQTRLLWAPNATVAAVLRANLSNALGVVHLGASDAEVQEAVGAMLPAHVVHLGPLVPGVVGPVQDVAARKEVARRQTVAASETGWCCAAKEWDKKQFPYAVLKYGPILDASQQHARLSASRVQPQQLPPWVPSSSIFQRYAWCDSDLLLPVNRNYTHYPQHPCTYLQGGPDIGRLGVRLRDILVSMLPQLVAAYPDGGLGFV